MSNSIDKCLWDKAVSAIKHQYGTPYLLPEQEKALQYLCNGNDVFVSLPTGYGKLLIFHSIPIIEDICFCQPRSSNVIFVISPLKSLMEDEVAYLESRGVPARALCGDETDPEIIQQIKNSCYILVYGSPESVLTSKTWRDILADSNFQELLVGVAIDEAHVVVQWKLLL